jgi:GT2 family glycosyltransferase
MERPLVSVIVVCMNNLVHLQDCFSSLYESDYKNLETIMLDNGSSDGSVAFVEERFPRIRIIRNSKNIGFPRSNNKGIKVARGEYVFLLNADTIVDPRCIGILVDVMEKDKGVGICGTKMLLEYEREIINSVGHNVNRIFYGWDRGCFEMDKGQYDEASSVPSVCNGAALYRKSIFGDIGLFDERFFLYCDDLDYGIRANLCGYGVATVPSARVYHRVNIRIENPRHHEFEEHRYRLRILLKNCPRELLWARLRESLLFDLDCIVRWFGRGDFRRASYRMRAIMWNLRVLADTLKERRRIQSKRRIDAAAFEGLFLKSGGYPSFNAPVPDYEFQRDDRVEAASIGSSLIVGEHEERHLGLGWYPKSSTQGRPSRWMGDYGIFYLGLPQGGAGERRCVRMSLYAREAVRVSGLVEKDRFSFDLAGGRWQELKVPFRAERELVKVRLDSHGLAGGAAIARGIALSRADAIVEKS